MVWEEEDAGDSSPELGPPNMPSWTGKEESYQVKDRPNYEYAHV